MNKQLKVALGRLTAVNKQMNRLIESKGGRSLSTTEERLVIDLVNAKIQNLNVRDLNINKGN